MIVEFVIFLVTSLVMYFIYTHKKVHRHFNKNGVKYLPGVPFFGNMMNSQTIRSHKSDDIDAVYQAFPDDRYVGLIENTTPVLLIRDPELIKTITVKDFDHFLDHEQLLPKEMDATIGNSLYMMKGDKWRDMKTILSPAFTGAKMRHMMSFMTEMSSNIVGYLKEINTDEIDVLNLMRRYTTDVITSAGFGIQVNSVKNMDNEFHKLGWEIFNITIPQRIRMTIYFLFPKLAEVKIMQTKIKLTVIPTKYQDFFRNLVTNTIELREKNNIERPDMIQLLMEASKGTLKHNTNTTEKDDVGFATVHEAHKPQKLTRKWTLDELAGQVFFFFAAGFDSSSSVLVMAIHELALNYDVQEKLYQEIKAFKDKRVNITYDNVNELKYLESVLNETLRKFPPAVALDRVCTKPYQLPPPREGGKPYLIKPGDIVYNMVNSIHMDPKYFAEPHKFDPDRFSDENKQNIKPFTFMPFGIGPRICIGSRFAILEMKVLIYNLVLNFKMLKCAKTTDPIELDPKDFINVKVKDGSWVKFDARY